MDGIAGAGAGLAAAGSFEVEAAKGSDISILRIAGADTAAGGFVAAATGAAGRPLLL